MSYVRLEMAKRRIVLLKPVAFQGSKHVGGVDVYLEPELAEQICKEVAVCLQVRPSSVRRMRMRALYTTLCTCAACPHVHGMCMARARRSATTC